MGTLQKNGNPGRSTGGWRRGLEPEEFVLLLTKRMWSQEINVREGTMRQDIQRMMRTEASVGAIHSRTVKLHKTLVVCMRL